MKTKKKKFLADLAYEAAGRVRLQGASGLVAGGRSLPAERSALDEQMLAYGESLATEPEAAVEDWEGMICSD